MLPEVCATRGLRNSWVLPLLNVMANSPTLRAVDNFTLLEVPSSRSPPLRASSTSPQLSLAPTARAFPMSTSLSACGSERLPQRLSPDAPTTRGVFAKPATLLRRPPKRVAQAPHAHLVRVTRPSESPLSLTLRVWSPHPQEIATWPPCLRTSSSTRSILTSPSRGPRRRRFASGSVGRAGGGRCFLRTVIVCDRMDS